MILIYLIIYIDKHKIYDKKKDFSEILISDI